MTDDKQPFLSHLKELRDRLLICVIAVAIAFVATYYFKEKIFDFLMQPFLRVMPPGSSFIFTGVTEAFVTYFKIAIVAALFVGAPVILYEFWMFVSPGLYEKEKKYVYPFIFYGSACFLCGALFCYFVVMPNIYRFFVSYGTGFVIPMPDIKSYMSLTLKMLILFGLTFELPLVAYYLSKAGIINARMLASKRRYAILAIFIISAIITPPDVVSQILIALPFWGLYELGILIARIFGKKEIRDAKA
ncbi:MAG: Sec-independent protein translocase protein TatC [Syntrophorhabdus sp. PtaU1.Bin050]|nr:MAG: Sec-independent protein translocase protein TatC [Syntrophorhabdus sp. PtaU1.Bin050]